MPKIVAFLGYDPFGRPPDPFPSRLKAARIAAGLTQRQLAVRLRVHPGTAAEWERGQARPIEILRQRIKATLGIFAGMTERYRHPGAS